VIRDVLFQGGIGCRHSERRVGILLELQGVVNGGQGLENETDRNSIKGGEV